ncbi:hypothetical protein GcM1_245009 [Golovinomyces cichoracearum]|uniref:Uncharacterized protein n=1 Tax=Golovinomyces cichoracearum TaxID=62708 RepID=A0A420IEV5_9PEZI|nr:hypothetical protein GcM1_245009 [Golovinomyces cichoracearum]
MQCFEVTRASTKELAIFIKAQYDVWNSEESFLDYELWATYTEIFKPLRSILRNRGVWVYNEAKQDTALFNCAQERIRGQWSSNEIDLTKESGGTPTFETSATKSESFYADRRFRFSNEHRSRNDLRQDIRGKQTSRFHSRGNTKEDSSNHYGKDKCWVCKKQGCRSYYHSDSEPNKARERFHKGADQYLAEYDDYLKSIDEMEEDDANSIEHNKKYEHLILDVKSPKNDATHQEQDGLSHDSDDQFFANTASAGEIFKELSNNSFLNSISHSASTI